MTKLVNFYDDMTFSPEAEQLRTLFECIGNAKASPHTMNAPQDSGSRSARGIRVERILSCGQSSGPYCQDEAEWVLLLEGKAEIEFCPPLRPKALSQTASAAAGADVTLSVLEESQLYVLKRGDQLFIPAGQTHWVRRTSQNCVWLCVFFAL